MTDRGLNKERAIFCLKYPDNIRINIGMSAKSSSDLTTGSVEQQVPVARGMAKDSGTKVDRIIESLTERIVAEEWGNEESLPSRNRLSEEYGVSPATISIAIRKLEQNGLLHIVPSRGVFVSENAAERNGKIIYPPIGLRGSYVPSDLFSKKSSVGYGMLLVRSIWEAAHEVNAPLVLMSGKSDSNRLSRQYCQSLGVRGVVFMGGETHEEAEELRKAGVPVMLANQPADTSPLNYVDYDHSATIREIVNRFIDYGHQRIAVLATSSTVKDFYQKFKPVFLQTLCDRGLEYNYNQYWRFMELDRHSETPYEVVATETEKLMQLENPPTAIFLPSHHALNCMNKVLKRYDRQVSVATSGYVHEEDMSVSGFVLRHEELGKELFKGINHVVENPTHFYQKLIPLKFVDKGTIFRINQ